MLKKISCLIVAMVSLPFAVNAATIQLPKTGQTVCYNAAGAQVECPGTGQDAEKQNGVAWPVPRFVDDNNGTVTDNLTGLVWLKNANCFDQRTWGDALAAANGLASGQCGLSDSSTAGQWRLPNVVEMQSLFDLSQADALNEDGPFTTIQASYWTSTTHARFLGNAWLAMFDGSVRSGQKTATFYVWPVRNAQ